MKYVAAIIVIGFILAGVVNAWPDPRIYQPVYYFKLPPMFVGCFTYKLRPGEVFSGWELEQPTVLDLQDAGSVTVSNVVMHVPNYAISCSSQ